jgi:hypothetical protein
MDMNVYGRHELLLLPLRLPESLCLANCPSSRHGHGPLIATCSDNPLRLLEFLAKSRVVLTADAHSEDA